MSYAEIKFCGLTESKIEILIALLSEAGYLGFEYGEQYLKAYITLAEFDKALLEQLSDLQQVTFTCKNIDDKNWNSEWEKSFAPVIINDDVSIRAGFHSKPKNVKYDVIITPKMSFGTGHHETTALMIEAMLGLNFKNKSVLDFGTGTGVLAILAEKFGAMQITAIDNDDNCIENATENAAVNECKKIIVSKNLDNEMKYDFVLANINKNTILEFLPALIKSLKDNGTLIISGFFLQDKHEMEVAAANNFLSCEGTAVKNSWLCMRFIADKQ